MRIINPFDPAIRDRASGCSGFSDLNIPTRCSCPQAKRKWGYYVYPLLERDRFVGRIEAKGDRSSGLLRVTGFWTEGGVRWGQGHMRRLQLELDRFARLAGLTAAAFEA